eukprot:4738054-Alexandrium_andersonii.AAC.1
MSASLVGSEMCIRDSAAAAGPAAAAAPASAGAAASSAPPSAGPSASQPCLLYTSDAADDM